MFNSIYKPESLVNCMELLHPRLCTEEATKSIYDDTPATDNALHVAITGLYLSSIQDGLGVDKYYLVHDLTYSSNILSPFVSDVFYVFGTPHSIADRILCCSYQ